MDVLGLAIDEGRVSVRRAAGLLDLTVEDLAELFAAHGVRHQPGFGKCVASEQPVTGIGRAERYGPRRTMCPSEPPAPLLFEVHLGEFYSDPTRFETLGRLGLRPRHSKCNRRCQYFVRFLNARALVCVPTLR